MGREFQVVVFGATGFTGGLICEFLLEKFGADGEELKWAMAGRSEKKLNKVKDTMQKYVGKDPENVPLIVADSMDEESLQEMCKRTDVVVSTVGPFARYGDLLVKACVDQGTDYVDSTGETSWIRRMIQAHHEEAEEKGIRLVPSCGYDSLPTDLAVLTMVSNIRDDTPDAKIKNLTHFIGPMVGGASGGTLHTAMNILTNEPKSDLIATYGNPYALAPSGKGLSKPKHGDQRFIQQEVISKSQPAIWSAPFFMAAGNERVVRRSAVLLSDQYGKSFQFKEVFAFASPFKAFMVAVIMSVGTALLLIPPIRMIVENYVLPDVGTGPSRKVQEKGFGTSAVHTQTDDGTHHVVEVYIPGDVGYRATSRMLALSAVQLAKTKEDEVSTGGFHTPASCPGLGLDLAQVLDEMAGLTFTYSKHDTGKSARKLIKTYDSKL